MFIIKPTQGFLNRIRHRMSAYLIPEYNLLQIGHHFPVETGSCSLFPAQNTMGFNKLNDPFFFCVEMEPQQGRPFQTHQFRVNPKYTNPPTRTVN